jgi:hypothetical protein
MWSAASKNAKQKMKTRAGTLGVDWDGEVAALAGARDWAGVHSSTFQLNLSHVGHTSPRSPV